MVHTYNPSHSGGSWFEASPRQIVREILSQKKPSQKRASGVAQELGPEFKPQYHQSTSICTR
jgi:hypothetical protein